MLRAGRRAEEEKKTVKFSIAGSKVSSFTSYKHETETLLFTNKETLIITTQVAKNLLTNML